MEAPLMANRDEPIPMLHDKMSNASAPSSITEKHPDPETQAPPGSNRFSERVLNSLIQQILPQQGNDDSRGSAKQIPGKSTSRPGFSLPLMSNNFRRFNARIGVVFVFQSRLINLLSWRAPTQTLAFLAVFSFCCLEPSLLLAAPVFASIFFIMVPAYLSRHPAPPNSPPTETFAMQGPASAPPSVIRPAPEMSKDFFRNMRDLQNCMEDFSVIHDRVVILIAPLTNFSDERTSTALFLMMFLAGAAVVISAAAIPWCTVFLVCGWLIVCSLHPFAALVMNKIDRAVIAERAASTGARIWSSAKADILLDEEPEVREVEIFELQRRRDPGDWQAWVFSTSPYDPLTPRRISGERPRGARFFEDVDSPRGWRWKEKKWRLDLLSRAWVEQHMITSVEVETEDELWVYDIMSSDDVEEHESQMRARDTGDLAVNSTSSPTLRGEWRRRRWIRLVQRNTLT